MKNISLLFLLFFLFLFSCEKSEGFLPVITTIKTDIAISGELREPEQQAFSPYRIEIGKKDNELGFLFWQGDISAGELATTLIMGAYPTNQWVGRPLFGFQFWSDQLPADRDWTAAELEDFFAPGTSFDFGRGPGKVDFFLRLPIGGPYAPEASRPSYLAEPEGTLIITAIEDFDYPTEGQLSERSYGKVVRCIYSGKLGRYDSLADQADGNPNFFQTDEVVEIRNGEAVFYVAYEER